MFNVKEFLIKSIIKSFEEGSMGEGQVGMTTMQYFLNGMLTEEDIEWINQEIETIKIDRQVVQEEFESYPDEEPPEDDAS